MKHPDPKLSPRILALILAVLMGCSAFQTGALLRLRTDVAAIVRQMTADAP